MPSAFRTPSNIAVRIWDSFWDGIDAGFEWFAANCDGAVIAVIFIIASIAALWLTAPHS